MIYTIVGIIITVLLSAFFSGMEITFVSSNKLLIEMNKNKGGISQKCISIFYKNPNNFVNTLLVGNNIVLVLYGILIAKLFNDTIFKNMSVGFTVPANTIISTIIILFTGEFIPKTLFKSIPNRLLTLFAVPAYVFYIILYPISRFTTFISKIMLYILGVKVHKEKEEEVFTKVDLDHLLQTTIDNLKENDNDIEHEVRIFQNALEFTDTKTRDCMIPRTEINSIEVNENIEYLKQLFIESGNSKIIVYKEDTDHILGYIHSSELFRHSKEWQKHIITMPFVPETMAAKKLMQILMQQKKSLAVVIDEFGGTSGIVSLEDIVEEIFGEIEDEHDTQVYESKKISETEFELSARLEIDKVNEMFDINLPESEDYMTIGGLILHYYKSIPRLNEEIDIDNYKFKIIKATARKIITVRLQIMN